MVVPAYEAEAVIGRCLDGLLAAGFAPGSVLVIDDGSRDATREVAARRGVRLVCNEAPQGAARARNRGAETADADILFFVDADVVVRPTVRDRLLARLEGIAPPVAVIGSYDDSPPGPSIVGRYRNLLHHYVHQQSATEASTFWTGLGAVRRDAFLSIGGFDTAWEKIEDTEFGVRLRRSGARIVLDRDLQGTHLKNWTTGSMFRTDLLGRAVPWSRLVLFHGGPRGDLNLSGTHRVSVLAVGVFVLSLIAAMLTPWALVLAALAMLAFVLANRAFLRFLARRRGVGFTLAALPFHALHYLAAGLGFGWVVLSEAVPRAFGHRRGGAG